MAAGLYAPWSWDGTQTNRSSDQGVKRKSRMKYMISDYKPVPLHLPFFYVWSQ